MRALIVLMGLPSSGKSTIARHLSKELNDKHGYLNIVIGTDDIRQLIPSQLDNFDPKVEPFIKELTFNSIQFCLKNDYIVINDDMNYYKSMRHDLKQISEENSAHFILIHIQIDLKTALKWNKKRGLPIPQEVIEKVQNRFDSPGDYHWDTPLLTIQPEMISPETAVSDILSKILPILESPLTTEPLPPPTKPGMSEKIDKITRGIVSLIAQKEKDSSILKQISKFRINYIKNYQIREFSVSDLVKDFTEELKNYISNIKQAQ